MKGRSTGHLKRSAAPLAIGLAMLSSPVMAQDNAPAQDAPAPSAAAAQPQEIIVTGSRIPQPNLEGVAPVTVINSQEFQLTGTTRTEDLINSLPQVFADQGGGVSNGATGTATVDLRNLGPQRTLVLINGRRLVPGDPSDSAADLNFVPAALVKRVDVLTGGASSTYGADAVGGVVNFIMDTDFTGFKLDGQYSFYQHGNHTSGAVRDALDARGFGFPDGSVADGGTVDATAVIGAAFDDNRGHVVAYAGYRRIDAVTQARRDYSSCSIGASAAGALSCGGSPTSANGTIFTYAGTPMTATGPYSDATSATFQVGPGGTLIEGSTPYNFAPTNYFQRPDERYTAGFFAHYDVSDAFKPYLEGMFMDDRSVAQIAPSGDFGNTFSVNCNNPLLSAQQAGIICAAGNQIARTVVRNPDTGVYTTVAPSYANTANVASVISNYQNYWDYDANAPIAGVPMDAFQPFDFVDPLTGATYPKGFAQILRRNVEGGPRQDDLQHTSFRIVAGAKGDLNNAFSYDAYYQYGRTNFAETYLNDFSVTRLGRALDVVADPSSGAPVCRSVLDGSDPNCVPYDVFSGNVSQASVGYLSAPGFQRAQVTEQVASVNFTGLLGEYGIKSPWAEQGIGINVGAEFRREMLNFTSDLEYQTGDLAGQGAAVLPVMGAFNVYEGFGEINVPIAHDDFVYDLSFDAGYRRSQYDVADRSFGTDTYKFGAEFAPIRQIRFRGSYNRAVRAPNLQELFAPQVVALDGNTDPCAGRPLTAADAGCLAQGLRIGQTVAPNPANQYNGVLGGNPDLTPEIADTYTAGIVLQPDFVPALQGLSITVDYFNIKVKNTIAEIGADTILAACAADASSPLCGLINRDSTGSLWRSSSGFVTDTTQNIGSIKTSGIDVSGNYGRNIGSAGRLTVAFNGTWLNDLTTDNGVATPYDCSGLYGPQCGVPAPKWRHKLRVGFALPNGMNLSAAWRYFGSTDVETSSDNPTLSGNPSVFARHLKPVSYFDLAATATVGDHYTFRIGVQNLFDKDPPIIPSSVCPSVRCNGNTFPVVYDALGRYIYSGITLNF